MADIFNYFPLISRKKHLVIANNVVNAGLKNCKGKSHHNENTEEEESELDQPQEVVHKLQRAVQYNASRQRLQQEAIAREKNNESSHDGVVEAREQRSQIAIIQMAPPSQQSLSSNRNNYPPKISNEANPVASSSQGQNISSNSSVQENVNSKKKRLHCSVHGCTYNTAHTKDLARHMRKHTGEKPYNCDRCTKSFTRYDKLVLHIRTHEGFRRFACRICSHVATDSSSLKKHQRTHTDERPYKCQLCSYSSKDSSQLVVHLRHHTGDSPYICTFSNCDAAFKTPSDLSRHTRLHTGEKPYKCSYCDYRAAVKCNLNAHMKRHLSTARRKGKSKTVVSVLPEENDRDSTKDGEIGSDLSRNILPFQYACKLCDFRADSIDEFNTHMKESHPGPNLGTVNQTGRGGKARLAKTRNQLMEKSFHCSSCKAAFVCEESLRCHLRQHVVVPNRPANVAPELYSPSRMRVVQKSTNIINTQAFHFMGTGSDANIESNYTLHELQKMPLVHSVITENPAVIGNSSHILQHHHRQTNFHEASTDQHHEYLIGCNDNTANVIYGSNLEHHHHQSS